MIEKFCEYLVNKMKKQNPKITNEEAEVILYGVQLIIGEIPKVILLFIVGMLIGFWWQTFAAFLLILPYRCVTGGFHLKTHLGCIICTNLFYCGNAILSTYFTFSNIYEKYVAIAVIAILSIICITKYAPADTVNVPILTKKERRNKKIASYIILAINLLCAVLIPNTIISNILIFGTLIQTCSITRIAYKITKNEYGYEVYKNAEQESIAI